MEIFLKSGTKETTFCMMQFLKNHPPNLKKGGGKDDHQVKMTCCEERSWMCRRGTAPSLWASSLQLCWGWRQPAGALGLPGTQKPSEEACPGGQVCPGHSTCCPLQLLAPGLGCSRGRKMHLQDSYEWTGFCTDILSSQYWCPYHPWGQVCSHKCCTEGRGGRCGLPGGASTV